MPDPRLLALIAALTFMLGPGSALADVVRLTGGDVLHGTIIEENESHLVFEHAHLGRLTIARAAIESIEYDNTPPPVDVQTPVETTPKPPAPEPILTPAPESKPAEWKSRAEIGFNGSEGRTQRFDTRIVLRSERTTEGTRLKLDSTYRTASSNGERIQNKLDAGAQNDWYFSDSPWFAFARGRLDLDEFARYDYRISTGGGLGYEWIRTERTDFTIEIGAGASREFGGPNEETIPEFLFNADLQHHLTDRQTLRAGFDIFPSLSEIGDYRAIARGEWEMSIDQVRGISLKLGMVDEFESRKERSQDDLLSFYGAIVIDF